MKEALQRGIETGHAAGPEDYDVLERLGEGAFGKVYKARHKKTEDFQPRRALSSLSRVEMTPCCALP